MGFDNALQPGQELVRQGIILLGREGDSDGTGVPLPRPAWALDGSFLCFRYLSQLVPEFQGFVDQNNPAGAPKDFFGSRLVGRWKSGTSVHIYLFWSFANCVVLSKQAPLLILRL